MRAGAAREDYQACAVCAQALHVGGQGGGAEIGSAWVDADANGWSEFAGDFSFLVRQGGGLERGSVNAGA